MVRHDLRPWTANEPNVETAATIVESNTPLENHPVALTLGEFNQMVDENASALYRTAYRLVGDPHEAEDVVQETFRSAWRGRDRFEQGRSDRAWLVKILRCRVADYWRKSRPKTVAKNDPRLDLSQDAEDPFRDELSDEMQKALETLSDDLRETLVLVVVAGQTHQEAADELGVPLGTVLSRVSRARTKLRKYFSELAAGVGEV